MLANGDVSLKNSANHTVNEWAGSSNDIKRAYVHIHTQTPPHTHKNILVLHLSISTSSPGRFTSNERITIKCGAPKKSRGGIGMFVQRYCATTSTLYLEERFVNQTHTGLSTSIKQTFFSTWEQHWWGWLQNHQPQFQQQTLWSVAVASWQHLTLQGPPRGCHHGTTNVRSGSDHSQECSQGLAMMVQNHCFISSSHTLFWRIIICCSLIISTAAKCSLVWGWGHGSFPATRSSAASITAAPLSMVAIRISWPGQSTKLTCRTSSHSFPFC